MCVLWTRWTGRWDVASSVLIEVTAIEIGVIGRLSGGRREAHIVHAQQATTQCRSQSVRQKAK